MEIKLTKEQQIYQDECLKQYAKDMKELGKASKRLSDTLNAYNLKHGNSTRF